MNHRVPTGRAATPEAKRDAVERLLAAWERSPHQRLGQLLINAANEQALAGAVGLFGIEDDALIVMVEKLATPGEVAPAIETSAIAARLPWGEKLPDNDAAKIGLDPAQDPIAAIERGAFVAVAKVAHRDGMTWDAVADKILADVEPEKLDLAHAVLSSARRRGVREPGLMMLASSTAISSPTTTCACYTCASQYDRMTRMILCILCGNKRCPKATHHDNACTNSNEPGQAGSRYA